MEFLPWLLFAMAAYAVLVNDAPQVLGTLIASNRRYLLWLWMGASVVLCAALIYSWNEFGGIAFDRLDKVPVRDISLIFILGPLALLALTYFGVPASTSLIMITLFADEFVLGKVIMKSLAGYVMALALGVAIWSLLARRLKAMLNGPEPNVWTWRAVQYATTAVLWWFWLTHDTANFAVFIPRQLGEGGLIFACVFCVFVLAWMFYRAGGPVHAVVFKRDKGDLDIRIAILIDVVYIVLLYVLKEWNKFPMSTSWAFLGLMSGRYIGQAIVLGEMDKAIRYFRSRLGLLTFGAIVSVIVGLLVNPAAFPSW